MKYGRNVAVIFTAIIPPFRGESSRETSHQHDSKYPSPSTPAIIHFNATQNKWRLRTELLLSPAQIIYYAAKSENIFAQLRCREKMTRTLCTCVQPARDVSGLRCVRSLFSVIRVS